eukprot:5847742-Amphidinium_carterae.4
MRQCPQRRSSACRSRITISWAGKQEDQLHWQTPEKTWHSNQSVLVSMTPVLSTYLCKRKTKDKDNDGPNKVRRDEKPQAGMQANNLSQNKSIKVVWAAMSSILDDLQLIGDDDKIKTFLQKLESQLQLKHVTKLQREQPLVFNGRQIEYYGDHFALSMTKEYYKSVLSLYNIKENTNSLATTGTKGPPIITGEQLNSEEHST